MLKDSLLRDFEKSVHRWYPFARDSILFYETEEGQRATEAITELRDVLDDFYFAGKAESEQEARELLGCAVDHLRSAAVEPLERATENRLYRVEAARQQLKGCKAFLWHILFMHIPSASQVQPMIDLTKEHIREGRRLKSKLETAEQAIQHFQAAHKQLVKLETLYEGTDGGNRLFTLISGFLLLFVFPIGGFIWGLIGWTPNLRPVVESVLRTLLVWVAAPQ
ncbi:MAG TPA: hypothetical protein VHS06_11925 [Chloroflexota bacterium]|nr:hypothetical protein [Chloroflexota bacterium]